MSDAISAINNGSRAILPYSHIVFDCENPAPIAISETWANPALTADHAKIAGTGRGIAFELSPACYNRCLGRCSNAIAAINLGDDEMTGTVKTCTQDRECGPSNTCKGAGTCSGGSRDGRSCLASGDCFGGTCTSIQSNISSVVSCTSDTTCSSKGIKKCSATNCPGVDAHGRRFLELQGDDQTLQDLTVRGFFDGVTITGYDDEIRNVTFERQCDDSVTAYGVASQIIGGTISKGCDKCTENYKGGAIASGCQEHACFNATYDGVSFQGCGKALKATGSAADGVKLHVQNVSVSPLSGFPCSGSLLGSIGIETLIEGGSVSGCDTGWALAGQEGAHTLTGGHYVTAITNRGIVGQGKPQTGNGGLAKLRGVVVQNNGGGNGASPRGGVAATDKGRLDLGKLDEPGNNKICRNTTTGTTARDVHINRDNLNVSAEYNYWRYTGGAPAVEIKAPDSGQTASTFSATQRFSNSTDPLPAIGTTCQ